MWHADLARDFHGRDGRATYNLWRREELMAALSRLNKGVIKSRPLILETGKPVPLSWRWTE
jgi:hypothetical protein